MLPGYVGITYTMAIEKAFLTNTEKAFLPNTCLVSIGVWIVQQISVFVSGAQHRKSPKYFLVQVTFLLGLPKSSVCPFGGMPIVGYAVQKVPFGKNRL